MKMSLKYTGSEALEMVKEYYPETWMILLENAKNFINTISEREKTTPVLVFKKHILNKPLSTFTKINFFAAVYSLTNDHENKNKKEKAIELYNKLEQIASQVVALEKDNVINYEDKKTLRSYYNQLREKTNKEYNQCINSFEVIEPATLIGKSGILDNNN